MKDGGGAYRYASLYSQPETSVARIEPTQRSIIHPSTMARLMGTHAAIERPSGNAMTKPISNPTRSAVMGPGPSVARTDT